MSTEGHVLGPCLLPVGMGCISTGHFPVIGMLWEEQSLPLALKGAKVLLCSGNISHLPWDSPRALPSCRLIAVCGNSHQPHPTRLCNLFTWSLSNTFNNSVSFNASNQLCKLATGQADHVLFNPVPPIA